MAAHVCESYKNEILLRVVQLVRHVFDQEFPVRRSNRWKFLGSGREQEVDGPSRRRKEGGGLYLQEGRELEVDGGQGEECGMGFGDPRFGERSRREGVRQSGVGRVSEREDEATGIGVEVSEEFFLVPAHRCKL